MLKNTDYIYKNILIANEITTSKQYCRKNAASVTLSARNFKKATNATTVLYSKSFDAKTDKLSLMYFDTPEGISHLGWHLEKGTYILELNEGCMLGPNDMAYITADNTISDAGCMIGEVMLDPEFTTLANDTVKPITVQFRVNDKHGVFIEKNAPIAKMVVFETE